MNRNATTNSKSNIRNEIIPMLKGIQISAESIRLIEINMTKAAAQRIWSQYENMEINMV